MRELMTANHALGDRAALDRIWDQHGYWFFRDVLDKAALGVMRDAYMRELKALELVDDDAREPLWNGRPLENFPAKFETLHQRRVWQDFVKAPKINAFFEEVLNDALYWIPMDYYRLVAPTRTPDANPYTALHQDGMSSTGVDFVTCWMPLMDIDADTGGLVIAEGQHERGYMDIVGGKGQFADGPIPDDSWSRAAQYRLGDVVIFTRSMPHLGLSNTSDRFRMSLDIRAVRRSSPLPVVGEVRAISADQVVIRNEDGRDVALTLDDKTFLRGPAPGSPNPLPITRSDVTKALPPGSRVMATEENGRAGVLRPQN